MVTKNFILLTIIIFVSKFNFKSVVEDKKINCSTLNINNSGKTSKLNWNTNRDSIPTKNKMGENKYSSTVELGKISLSEEFVPFLYINKNKEINLFKFNAISDGNILLQGFVSAGTNNKMLYTRFVINGEIIDQKTCGIGNPIINGIFNFQNKIKKGDQLSIQLIVLDANWQLHCCPDLYNCTYIFTTN